MLGKAYGLGLAQLLRLGLGYSTSSAQHDPHPGQDWQLEENTDVWLLEDGSGSWLLEES